MKICVGSHILSSRIRSQVWMRSICTSRCSKAVNSLLSLNVRMCRAEVEEMEWALTREAPIIRCPCFSQWCLGFNAGLAEREEEEVFLAVWEEHPEEVEARLLTHLRNNRCPTVNKSSEIKCELSTSKVWKRWLVGKSEKWKRKKVKKQKPEPTKQLNLSSSGCFLAYSNSPIFFI